MGFVKQVWRGEKSLAFTYWIFAVLGNLAFKVVDAYMPQLGYGENSTQGMLFLLLNLFYAVFISVAVWRSASVYITKGKETENGATEWGYVAKSMVMIGWVLPVLLMIGLLL